MQVVCIKDEGSMAPTTVDQSCSKLLSLPAELRNAIWYLLLIHDQKTYSRWNYFFYPRKELDNGETAHKAHRFCTNVLATCKQINAEATPILYGENTFTAHPSLLATLPSLILSTKPSRIMCPPVISQRAIRLIRRFHVHVRLDTDPRFTKRQVEESFSGAKELAIEVFQAMYGSSDFTVLKLFESVRAVERAVVYGSVGDGRYASWLARAMMSPVGAEVVEYNETYIGGDRAWDAWMNGNR